MSNQRIDLYAPFHKGIRKLLLELLIDVGKTDFRQDDACRKICDDLSGAIGMLREHSKIEDEVFHPALESRAPGAVRELEEQHQVEEEKIDGLEAQVAQIREATVHDRPDLGLHLYRSLGLFCATYLNHLATEEAEMVPLFWKHFRADELAELRQRIERQLPSDRRSRWLTLVVPALDESERATVLRQVKDSSPDVFAAATKNLRELLPVQEWSPLARALGIE